MTDEHRHHCIAACHACIEAAGDCVGAHLGDVEMRECLQACLDCLDLCRSCIGVLSRRSSFAPAICRLCEHACSRLSAECARFDSDEAKRAARAAALCAAACGTMAA